MSILGCINEVFDKTLFDKYYTNNNFVLIYPRIYVEFYLPFDKLNYYKWKIYWYFYNEIFIQLQLI